MYTPYSYLPKEFSKVTYRNCALSWVQLLLCLARAGFAASLPAVAHAMAELIRDIGAELNFSPSPYPQIRALLLLLVATHIPQIRAHMPSLLGVIMENFFKALRSSLYLSHSRKYYIRYELCQLNDGGLLGGSQLDTDLAMGAAQITSLILALKSLEVAAIFLSGVPAELESCMSALAMFTTNYSDGVYGTDIMLKDNLDCILSVLKKEGVALQSRSESADGVAALRDIQPPNLQCDEDLPPSVTNESLQTIEAPIRDPTLKKIASAPDPFEAIDDHPKPTVSALPSLNKNAAILKGGSQPLAPSSASTSDAILQLFATSASSPVSAATPRFDFLSDTQSKTSIELQYDMQMFLESCVDVIDVSRLCRLGDSKAGEEKEISLLDIFGAMSDVISVHLPRPPQGLGSSTSFLDEADRALSHDCQYKWELISGSSDLLTVFGSMSFHPAHAVCEVRLKVCNGSGFKVTNVALELTALDTENGTFELIEKLFIDEIVPNAIVYKTHFYEVLRLGALQIETSILYSDLISPAIKNVFLPPTLYGEEKNETALSSEAQKFIAILKQRSLGLPVLAQLLPYGMGVFSSISKWYDVSTVNAPGIPSSVYQQLWERLPFAVKLPLKSTATFRNLLPAGSEALSYVLSTINRAMPTDVGSIFSRARVQLREESAGSLILAAWCWSTVWGDDCALRLTVVKSRGGDHDECEGYAEMRAGSAASLKPLRAECSNILRSLSKGLLTLRDDTPITRTSVLDLAI